MSKILKALEKAQREGVAGPAAPGGEDGAQEIAAPVAVEPRPADAAAAGSGSVPGPAVKEVSPDRGMPPVQAEAVDPYLEAFLRPQSIVAEQYRGLRNKLERLSRAGGQRVVAFTSAVKGEGKSVTVANLALTFAQDANKRILLVDADLRRPRVHQMMGLARGPGLAELLQGRAGAAQVVKPFPGEPLDVVTAGEPDGHPGELLTGEALRDALTVWRREYDFVLMDTPPVHPIADVAFLSEAVDGYVVVVRARKTGKEQLEELLESLPREKILGAVLNRADSSGGRYRYKKDGYEYGYY